MGKSMRTCADMGAKFQKHIRKKGAQRRRGKRRGIRLREKNSPAVNIANRWSYANARPSANFITLPRVWREIGTKEGSTKSKRNFDPERKLNTRASKYKAIMKEIKVGNVADTNEERGCRKKGTSYSTYPE